MNLFSSSIRLSSSFVVSNSRLTIGGCRFCGYVNRNPRNLEQIRYAKKQQGWILEKDKKEYWHRIVFEVRGRHTRAYVQHYNDDAIVVQASTGESCIQNQLLSTTDVNAARAIGDVLARRCLESGILRAFYDVTSDQLKTSDKIRSFYSALDEGGIMMVEPGRIRADLPFWSDESSEKLSDKIPADSESERKIGRRFRYKI